MKICRSASFCSWSWCSCVICNRHTKAKSNLSLLSASKNFSAAQPAQIWKAHDGIRTRDLFLTKESEAGNYTSPALPTPTEPRHFSDHLGAGSSSVGVSFRTIFGQCLDEPAGLNERSDSIGRPSAVPCEGSEPVQVRGTKGFLKHCPSFVRKKIGGKIRSSARVSVSAIWGCE